MFNKHKFKASVIAAGMNMEDVASFLELNTSTLYRKINGSSDFTRIEIKKIQDLLNLDICKIGEIFFT